MTLVEIAEAWDFVDEHGNQEGPLSIDQVKGLFYRALRAFYASCLVSSHGDLREAALKLADLLFQAPAEKANTGTPIPGWALAILQRDLELDDMEYLDNKYGSRNMVALDESAEAIEPPTRKV